MTTLRGGAHGIPAADLHVSARAVAIVLAAALAVALVALTIVIASSSGSSEPVRIAPTSGPIPPSAAERGQPLGLDGPGLRP